MLTAEEIEAIKAIRKYAHWWMVDGDNEDLAVCERVSLEIERVLGYPMVLGDCLLNLDLSFHCWNVLPGGYILDATADQFGAAGFGETGIELITPLEYVEAYTWYTERDDAKFERAIREQWRSFRSPVKPLRRKPIIIDHGSDYITDKLSAEDKMTMAKLSQLARK